MVGQMIMATRIYKISRDGTSYGIPKSKNTKKLRIHQEEAATLKYREFC